MWDMRRSGGLDFVQCDLKSRSEHTTTVEERRKSTSLIKKQTLKIDKYDVDADWLGK